MELNNIEPAHKEYTVLWLLDYAHMMLLDERSYWNWLIGVEMELGKVEQAYYHCKEAILNHDIHGLFALVQGKGASLMIMRKAWSIYFIWLQQRKAPLAYTAYIFVIYCTEMGSRLRKYWRDFIA